MTGICCLDNGNHLVVSDSTSNKLSFFDLRMNLDQMDTKLNSIANKKAPPISLVCTIDSSEHLGEGDKSCKMTGTASMRLHKESNSLAVIRSDNQMVIFNMSKLDTEPPRVFDNPNFKSGFYIRP